MGNKRNISRPIHKEEVDYFKIYKEELKKPKWLKALIPFLILAIIILSSATYLTYLENTAAIEPVSIGNEICKFHNCSFHSLNNDKLVCICDNERSGVKIINIG